MTQEDEKRELREFFLFCFFNERTLSHYIRGSNIRVTGISEEEENKGTESLLKEIIDENFQILRKELDFRIEDTNKTPNYIVLMQKDLSKTHIIQTVKN